MAALVPISFPEKPRPSIISFDWVDVASGTGYVQFFGARDNNVAGRVVGLVPTPFSTGSSINEGTWNLDTAAFTLPQVIGGRSYVNFFLFDSDSSSHNVSIKFIKVTTAGTTDISSAIVTTNLTTATTFVGFSLFVDVTSTHFAIGDSLRIEVIISSGGGESIINFDNAGGHEFIADVPFRIEG